MVHCVTIGKLILGSQTFARAFVQWFWLKMMAAGSMDRNRRRTGSVASVKMRGDLHRASDAQSRQMTAAGGERDCEREAGAGSALDESLGSGTQCGARPGGPWLEACPAAGGLPAEVYLVRCRAGQGRAEPVGVVPSDVQLYVAVARTARERHDGQRSAPIRASTCG